MLPPKIKNLEPIHLLYDARMLNHRPVGWVEPEVFPEYLDDISDDYPMENPERLRVIYERLLSLENRLMEHDSGPVFSRLACPMATREQILLAHNKDFVERMEDLQFYSDAELADISYEHRHDIYYNQESYQCARLAAGGLIACVDAACANVNQRNKALALIRPPGHHACQTQEMGTFYRYCV
jgi:histone deacetylase 6